MKILFLLPAGVIEWEMPPEGPQMTFNQVATQVRMAGYFMAENIYLRHDAMVGMLPKSEDAPQYKPAGGTLQ